MTCPCCDSSDVCLRCGTCSVRWVEEIVDGELEANWTQIYDEDGFMCSGGTYLDGAAERLNGTGALCTCTLSDRGGAYNGEVISGLCGTQGQGFCRCCTATYTDGAWELAGGCVSTHNQITSHGDGFVIRTVCTCPTPGSPGTEGQTVQLDCVESWVCAPSHPDCVDP